MPKIDLSEISGKSRYLTDADKGRQAAQTAKITGWGHQPVKVVASGDLRHITPSFIEGILGDAVAQSEDASRFFDMSDLPFRLRQDIELAVSRLYRKAQTEKQTLNIGGAKFVATGSKKAVG